MTSTITPIEVKHVAVFTKRVHFIALTLLILAHNLIGKSEAFLGSASKDYFSIRRDLKHDKRQHGSQFLSASSDANDRIPDSQLSSEEKQYVSRFLSASTDAQDRTSGSQSSSEGKPVVLNDSTLMHPHNRSSKEENPVVLDDSSLMHPHNNSKEENLPINTALFIDTPATELPGPELINEEKVIPEDLLTHSPVSTPAGPLWESEDDEVIPRHFNNRRKRVLVLCTGGTLTMAKDPNQGHSLAPVEGALTNYLKTMPELTEDPDMPEVVAHEYSPLIDSSDMGPGDWALLASDIGKNYYHFDGFVILTGTDTMAYAASALSFMLENLGKPVVFTGSQIPLSEPYNDARKNLIMALIFACRDTLHEVTIFFHDRLLRACRATKANTSKLLAFDSPNCPPLALTGITIDENQDLLRPPPRWRFRFHTRMETRLITLRLVPGFDDAMMRQMIKAARETHLKGLILQLYGTGNLPSLKEDFIQVLADASEAGVCVVACTQCITGCVMMGHYATGRALKRAGVVSANDMTVEATNCKLAYLLGRGDLNLREVRDLMGISLRGEVTPQSELSPPPLSSAYQQAIQKQQEARKLKNVRGVAPY